MSWRCWELVPDGPTALGPPDWRGDSVPPTPVTFPIAGRGGGSWLVLGEGLGPTSQAPAEGLGCLPFTSVHGCHCIAATAFLGCSAFRPHLSPCSLWGPPGVESSLSEKCARKDRAGVFSNPLRVLHQFFSFL